MQESIWLRPQKMNRLLSKLAFTHRVLIAKRVLQLVFLFLFILTGCFHTDATPKPKLTCVVQDRYIRQLPSPFPPLSSQEQAQDWGKEYQIGLGFAHELDLYQALTAFKRATYLKPSFERRLCLEYNVLLCYYLAGKYAETIYSFENTDLRTLQPNFPAHHDLLVILYDSYIRLDQTRKSEQILTYIEQFYPETAKKLALSGILIRSDIEALEKSSRPDIQTLLAQYNQLKKSTTTAQLLNALLPGAGYLYLGQKQSAITAFLLNGLFIWAAIYFFQHGNIAAGIIAASFEAGWYFGGIYGGGLEAEFYNERIYEHLATHLMNENLLFPILMLKYGF